MRSTGPGVGAIDFSLLGANGTPVTGVATVWLRASGSTWSVTAVTTANIRVDRPVSSQVISSPVTVSGTALAYEGTVEIRVVRVSANKVTEMGTGYVTGGGDVQRPFTGQVSFTPAGTGAAWMVFVERSARDGGVLRAAAVPVTVADVPVQQVVGSTRVG